MDSIRRLENYTVGYTAVASIVLLGSASGGTSGGSNIFPSLGGAFLSMNSMFVGSLTQARRNARMQTT